MTDGILRMGALVALGELSSAVLFGSAAVAGLSGLRARRVSSLLLLGLLALAAESCLFAALPDHRLVIGAALVTRLSAVVVLFRCGSRARDYVRRVKGLLWPLAACAATLSLAGLFVAPDYLAGLPLDADALVFWSLRGHFFFQDGPLSSTFWNVVHADYPPLLPLLNAHGFFLLGASGEVPTAATAWVLAFVALFAVLEALGPFVGCAALVAVPVLFVLAPVPIYPIHSRILLAGYAETWSILFVALVCGREPATARLPPTAEEAIFLVTISLLKSEGFLIAAAYLGLRCLAPALSVLRRRDASGFGGLARAAARSSLVLFPGFLWILSVRFAAVETHFRSFALPTLGEAVARMASLVEYYRALPRIYALIPLVLVLLLWSPVRDRSRGRFSAPDPWDGWLVANGLLLYGLLLGVVVLFRGSTRLVLENAFHRLHWSILLVALIAAARMISRRESEPAVGEGLPGSGDEASRVRLRES